METVTVNDAETARNRCAARLKELRDRETALSDAISALSEQAQQGATAGLHDIAALASQKKQIAAQIIEAEGALHEAEIALTDATNCANEKEFERVLADARIHRGDFVKHFREAALNWGRFCELMERATVLHNELQRGPMQIAFPHHSNALRELSEKCDPYAEWPVSPHAGWGWNANLPAIAPVKMKFQGGKN